MRLLLNHRVWLLVLALVIAAPAHANQEPVVESATWNTDYDSHFQKYTKRYFGPGVDWRWFKAQAIAESRLNPKVRSPVGAIGLMQIMPTTYAEIRSLNPQFGDITTPRWNIAAGIFYDRYLFTNRAWDGLPDQEKLLVTFAAYNAGLGGMMKARNRSTPKPTTAWHQIAPFSPQETQGYVRRIARLKGVEASASGHKQRDPRLKGANALKG